MDWLRKAAAQGHSGAMTNLGALYATRDSKAYNPIQAYVWYIMAAASTQPGPEREGLEAKAHELGAALTSEDRHKAQVIMEDWKKNPKLMVTG